MAADQPPAPNTRLHLVMLIAGVACQAIAGVVLATTPAPEIPLRAHRRKQVRHRQTRRPRRRLAPHRTPFEIRQHLPLIGQQHAGQ